ncbi:MAG TPA: DUF2066 domain-containing protein [Gammaproteobacteria bacterium]|nr:DUF2066 domain-containing protein [Gammaproteobacteria bacterium]
MNSPRILSLLIVLVLMPAPVVASVVQHLYSASIPVNSQSDQVREQALHQALRQVIVKVTGSRAAPDDPQVAAIVAQPEHYLQAYRYTRHVPGPNEPLFGPGASATLDLVAQFDQPTVDQALRAAGQPLWGSERPETIVWIAYQQGDGQRHIVGSEAPGEVLANVQHAAKLRGVPVIFPLMDVQDRAHIAFSDVWGGFTAPVVQASQRYQPDAILIGKIDTNGANASARWTLVMGGKSTNWDGANGAPADVARAAIQHLADVYASTFVVHNGAGAQHIPALDIVVSNIDGLTGFGRVLNYLRSLNALGAVEPMQFHGGVVTFKASAQGTVEDIRQTIGLGAVLKADDSPHPVSLPGVQTVNQPVTLHYLYQP